MNTMQTSSQTVQMNPTEALWTLIQSQSQAVKKTLAKRLMDWELQTKLDAARKDIKDGKGVTVNNKEDLMAYLDTL